MEGMEEEGREEVQAHGHISKSSVYIHFRMNNLLYLLFQIFKFLTSFFLPTIPPRRF